MSAVFFPLLVYAPLVYHLSELKRFVFIVTVFATVLATSYRVFAEKKRISIPRVPVLIYGGWLMWNAVSLLVADWTFQSDLFFSTHVAVLFLGIAIDTIFRSIDDLFQLFSLWVLPVALIALFAFVNPQSLVVGRLVIETERARSLLGNTNLLGAALILTVPFVVWRAISAPSQRVRIVALFTATIGVAAQIASTSRGAWLGTIVAVVVIIWVLRGGSGTAADVPLRHKTERRPIRAVAVFLIVVVVCGVAVRTLGERVHDTVSRSIHGIQRRDVLDSRLPAWQAAVGLWLSDPPRTILVGAGPGSYYAQVFALFPADHRLRHDNRSFKHAHSEYLQVLAESGLIGLVLWSLYFSIGVYGAIVIARDDRLQLQVRAAGAALAAALVAALVQAIFSLAYRRPGILQLFYLLPLLVSILRSRLDSHSVKRERLSQHASNWAVVCAIVLISGAAWFSTRHMLSQFHMHRAMFARYDSPAVAHQSGLRDLYRAVQWDPQNVYAWYIVHVAHRQSDPQNTIHTANIIESIIPQYRDTVEARARAYATIGEYHDAATDFDTVVAYDRYDIESHIDRIVIRALMNHDEQVRLGIEEAITAASEWSQHLSSNARRTPHGNGSLSRRVTAARIETIESELGFSLQSAENYERIGATVGQLVQRDVRVARAFVNLSIGYVLLARNEIHYAIDLLYNASRAGVLSSDETEYLGELACAVLSQARRTLATADATNLSAFERKHLEGRSSDLTRIIDEVSRGSCPGAQ